MLSTTPYYDKVMNMVFNDFMSKIDISNPGTDYAHNVYIYDADRPTEFPDISIFFRDMPPAVNKMSIDEVFQMERDLQKQIDKAIPEYHSTVRLRYNEDSRDHIRRSHEKDGLLTLFTLGIAIPFVAVGMAMDSVKYTRLTDYSIEYTIHLRKSEVMKE